LPQAPQLASSLDRSRQVPEQTVWPLAQVTVHAPFTHREPDGQAVPQAPQFWLSARMSRQLPEQLVVPGGQSTAHCPLAQTVPARHV
jgi:hypothetical protein